MGVKKGEILGLGCFSVTMFMVEKTPSHITFILMSLFIYLFLLFYPSVFTLHYQMGEMLIFELTFSFNQFNDYPLATSQQGVLTAALSKRYSVCVLLLNPIFVKQLSP